MNKGVSFIWIISLFIVLALLAILSGLYLFKNTMQQEEPITTTVEDIIKNSESFIGKTVEVEGYLRAVVIDRMIEGKSEVHYFLEEGVYRIQLIFNEPPSFTEIGSKVKIIGKVNEQKAINVISVEFL